MRQYPIEQYEKQIPWLLAKLRRARWMSTFWAVLSFPQMVLGAAEGNLWNWGVFGVLISASMTAAVYGKMQDGYVDMIQAGQRPYAVRKRLEMLDQTEQLVPVEPKDFAGEIEQAQREGERAALREKDQWWRQPGSLWHQTQEFIDATQSMIDTHEEAARQAARDLRIAKEKAAQDAARSAEQRAESERRIAATQRWLDEQREWDAFKEDAQIDARERKERGDWHEPPPGIPGALPIDDSKAEEIRLKRELEAKIKEISDRINRNILASYSPELHEIHAWDRDEPVLRIFRGRP